MSRVIGITVHDLIEKGSSLRSYSCFLRRCKDLEYLVPVNECKKENFQGATVIEPVKGFHTYPSACGDFQSLYPNEMRAINADPSTYINPDELHEFDVNDYNIYEVEIVNKKGNLLNS